MSIISNIPTSALERLDAKFVRLTKRAAKCGAVAPAYQVTAIRYLAERDAQGEKTGRFVEVVDVRVHGAATQIDGYDLVGVIDTSSFAGQNLVKVYGDVEFPQHLRDSKPVCDHCGLDRKRNDIVVLRSPEGQYVRLGRSCVGLYVPGGDPETAILCAKYYDELREAASEPTERVDLEFRSLDVLAIAAAVVAEFGFVSKAAASDDFRKHSTCSAVEAHYSRDPKARVETSAADYEKAKAVIAWAKGLDLFESGLGNYGESLRVVCSSELAPVKYWGILVSAIAAHDRFLADEVRAEREAVAKAASEWVGEVKKRQDFVVECERIIRIDGYYGVTGLHILRDESGNAIKWFASEGAAWLEEGDKAVLKATVKAHEEYEGEQQTVVTRAKVVEILSEAA